MIVQPTRIPDVLLIQPQVFGDERGFFMETYRANEFERAGITSSLVQENHTRSKQGVLRGLHYQVKQTQGKLIRVILGEVFDVSVDLRRSSPTFRQWVRIHLSAENKLQVWIPPGFAHGFYVLSEWADVVYKVTDYWSPEWERSLRWNDPDIGVDWQLLEGNSPLLSSKDAQGKFPS
jgi:dTDP-4-dehydrorhamnose 3,5-epimerase